MFDFLQLQQFHMHLVYITDDRWQKHQKMTNNVKICNDQITDQSPKVRNVYKAYHFNV